MGLGMKTSLRTTLVGMQTSLAGRAMLGALAGIAAAFMFSAWLTVGRLTVNRLTFELNNGPWLESVVIYFSVLPVTGILVGLMSSLYRNAVGAFFLGFVALFPLFYVFGTRVLQGSSIEERAIISVVGAVIVGGGSALQMYSERDKTRKSPRSK
jgi:hypothetical protein